MAREMPALAYFRARLNDQAPLLKISGEYDAVQMRKHPEYFECDAEGKALDGKSESLPKYVPKLSTEELAEVEASAGHIDAQKATLRRGTSKVTTVKPLANVRTVTAGSRKR